MRRFPALIGAAALVTAALAGCSTTSGYGSTACFYDAGEASTAVTVTGDVGTEPTVDFPTPLIAKGSQVSTVSEGDDDAEAIGRGQQVDYDYAIYYGATGEKLSATGYGSSDSSFARSAAALEDNSIARSLECATPGERYVLTTTAAASFGAGTLEANGIQDDDTLVVVVDVIASYLGKADGVNQLPLDRMPNVVTEVNGRPGINIVSGWTAPTTTRAETVKAGGGAVVKKDDQVVTHFSLWTWPTAEQDAPVDVRSTWDANQAATFGATSVADGGGLPAGLVDAMIGAKIGSQLLVVIPPGDDSFPADSLPTGVSADATLIFVVDLLGIAKD